MKERFDHQKKLDWAKSLCPGDIIIDCRFQARKIIKIYDEFQLKRLPPKAEQILNSGWFPEFLSNFIYDCHIFFCNQLDWVDLADRSLTLEGGYNCSAMYCCEPLCTSENP